MAHVVVAGPVDPAGLARLEAAGHVAEHVADVDLRAYLPRLPAADALILRTQPLDAAAIAAAPRLRMVSRHGVGCDAVDIAALTARGIPLAIVGDVNSRAVAEHAMALLLAAGKRLLRHDRAVRESRWGLRNGFEARELFGARLLIVGFGRSGRLLAGMAVGFGMRISAFTRSPGRLPDGVARETDLRAALAAADYVSLHVPGGGAPVIGVAEIAAMQPHAVLVCTSRGGVVDEAALAAALGSGRLGAAGLDVFAAEPPDPGDPLLTLDRLVLTPHIAGTTAEAARRMAEAASENVVAFFEGRLDPALTVNAAALASPPLDPEGSSVQKSD